MSENSNTGFDKSNLFSFLYRTRIQAKKGDVTIVNLSLIFSLLALLSAPWLVVIGIIVSLMMGYRFGVERNAAAFSGSFDTVVKTAASNVKSAVEGLTHEKTEDSETRDGMNDPH